jgi:hypothetical protein
VPFQRNYKKLEKLHARIHKESNFFPGQRDSEVLKLCVRTHWSRELGIFLKFLALAVVAPLIFIVLLTLIRLNSDYWIPVNLALTLYLLFAWLFTFIEFQKNEFTVLLVTDERLIDITQKTIFNQQVSETALNRIQEVMGFTKGIMGAFLDVGKLEVQTAGSDIPLIMPFVKAPHLTARKILDIQKMGSGKRRASDASGRREGDEVRMREGETLSKEEILALRGKKTSSNPLTKRRDANDAL